MKRKQLSEKELVAAIDQARANARLLEIDADALDLTADLIFKSVKDVGQREAAKGWREQAKKKRRRAASLCDARIPNLSRRLACVRTMPLPPPIGGGRRNCMKTRNAERGARNRS